MSILVIAEHDNDNLSQSTLNTITAALELGDDIDLLVAGSNCEKVSNTASQIPNIKHILSADSPEYKNFIAENISALVVSIAEKYSHILCPSSTTGKNFMPRVAANLDVMQISDIIKVIDENTFQRPKQISNLKVSFRCKTFSNSQNTIPRSNSSKLETLFLKRTKHFSKITNTLQRSNTLNRSHFPLVKTIS